MDYSPDDYRYGTSVIRLPETGYSIDGYKGHSITIKTRWVGFCPASSVYQTPDNVIGRMLESRDFIIDNHLVIFNNAWLCEQNGQELADQIVDDFDGERKLTYRPSLSCHGQHQLGENK